MPPRRQQPKIKLPEIPEGQDPLTGLGTAASDTPAPIEWDGINYKDGFHVDPSGLSEEQVRTNKKGVAAARLALHGELDASAQADGTDAQEKAVLPEPSKYAARMAGSRLLNVLGISYRENDDLSDLDPNIIKNTTPGRLAAHLMGRGVILDKNGQGRQAVLYTDGNNRWRAVALSAAERKLLADNITAYGKSAAVRSIDRQNRRGDSVDYATADRAIVHTLEPKITQMESYLENLTGQEETLNKFIEAFDKKHIGLSRGSEITMRMKFTEVLEIILPSALDAIRDQLRWSPEQTDAAKRAIMANLFATDNSRIAYAQNLCKMLKTYTQTKKAVFEDRLDRARAYVAPNERRGNQGSQ